MRRSLGFLLLGAFLAASPAFANPTALFDNTKAQTAGNADWVIDNDQPVPSPPQSGINWATPENYWTGANSAWGVQLVKRGYTVATLTSAFGITYQNLSNPYDLSKYNVFIVDEPNTRFSSAESTAIFNFVRDGGGLFVISDHNGSDRNNDGFDSPHIWNLFDAQHLLGVHFNVTGDPNNSITATSANVNTSPTDSIIHGVAGLAPGIAFHAGTTMTLDTAANPSVTGDVWMAGQPQGSTVGGMVAHSQYGAGRIVFVSDSSPADDGSGNGGSLFTGWAEDADSLVFLNGTLWVSHSGGVIAQSWTITASAGPNGAVSPGGAVSVLDGSTPAFTMTPNAGFHVADVLVNGVTVGAVTNYTFPPVHSDQTLSASFAANPVDSIAPTVMLTAPVGGESWQGGTAHAVTWTASDNLGVTAIDLAYSTDGGATFPNAIASGLANSGSYTWTVPGAATTTARVRVVAHDASNNLAADSSHADFTILAASANSYVWIATGSAAWTTATNWTPTRTTPGATDVLAFSGGGSVTATGVPTQTISQLMISGNTSVTLQASAAVTLSMTGFSGTGLDLAPGSAITLSGSSALTLALGSGAMGSIRGPVAVSGGSHRLLAAGTQALAFETGSSITLGTGFSGNVFGNGTAPGAVNSVVFRAGSLYAQAAGANPFGATAPATVVIFQPGSRFRLNAALTPSMSGRDFADFELNAAGTISPSGANPWSADSVIVTQGTLSLGGLPGGGTIRGSVTVRPGAMLNFSPTSSTTSLAFAGSTNQPIGILGSLVTTANSSMRVNNPAGVTLATNVSLNGPLTFTSGLVTTGPNTLAIAATGGIGGASQATGYVAGNLRRSVAAGSQTVVFDVGDATTYAPVTLAMNGTTAFDLTAATHTPDHPNLGSSDLDPAHSVNRWWTLAPASTPTLTGFDATFTFAPADLDAGTDPANLVIRRYNGAWFATNPGTDSPTSTQAMGVTDFGDFAIGQLPTAGVGPATATGLDLARPQPNPSSGSATLSFSLPRSGRASLDILDLAGRRIWHSEATYEAGVHRATWPGTTSGGAAVAAGVYLVRLDTPWGARVARLVRLR